MKVFLLALLSFYTSFGQIINHSSNASPLTESFTLSKKKTKHHPYNIKKTASYPLSDSIPETSGLLFLDNLLYTHNDDHDTTLYGIDTLGKIQKKIPLQGITNIDWEEITQDSTYFYIGDFGNNARGNRTDLKILKIAKKSLLDNRPQIDTIQFSYADQTNYKIQPPNTTDYDCEAFIATKDHLYLFTKQWKATQCSLYAIPNQSGKQTASLLATYNSKGLITGACFLPSKNTLVLCGYSRTLRPFILHFSEFVSPNFFAGAVQKIDLHLPFHQIESITSMDGTTFFLSNEALVKKPFLNIPQQLHRIKMEPKK